jgi:hypothetical protein
VTEAARDPASQAPQPPELEARIAALEQADNGEDFDRRSWFWMVVFGIALPLALVLIGWPL